MKLSKFLSDRGLNLTAFGRLIDVPPETARRYASGARIPHPDIMKRIIKATRGAVQPNDFYGTANAKRHREGHK
jgi:predicted transcriptional regulator